MINAIMPAPAISRVLIASILELSPGANPAYRLCEVHVHRMVALIACVASLVAGQSSGQPREILVPAAFAGAPPILDSKIVFTSNRDQLPEPRNFEPTEIYLMNGNGSDQRRLTRTNWNEGAPDWSPNGTRVA